MRSRYFICIAAVIATAAAAPTETRGASRPKADLALSALTVKPSLLTAGTSLTVRATLRPRGVVKKSVLLVVLSKDRRFDRKDVRLGSRVSVPKLRRKRTLTARRTIPTTLSGRRFVIACVDAARRIRERSERNNCRATRRAITITPASGPFVPPVTPLPGLSTPPAGDPDTTIDSGPPTVTAERTARFTFTGTGAARFECRLDDAAFAACASPAHLDALRAGEHVFRVRAISAGGAADPTPAEYPWRIGFDAPVVGPSDPPAHDPSAQAPPTPPGEVTTIGDSTAFLYTGSNPVQTGVADDTITDRRAAVVRGRVVARSGAPVGGVRVTVLEHPELGRTATRADGTFDLAVNGGGPLTLDFRRAGFIGLQRTDDVTRQDYTVLDDVTLIAYDEHVTEVATGAAATQVARGARVSDGDGSRRATLLFQPATEAFMVMPDGSERPLSELDVRATEYTVGERGPSAMPGQLPPTSAYTYAVELSVDQALEAGAVSVRFTKPVANYVENFVGLPVGSSVPTGSYDRGDGVWEPEPDGVIVKIVGEQAGSAQLDVDGDGTADTGGALASRGIGVEELAKLASLYEPGVELWRVAVDHFTPWDHNWPYGLPDDAEGTSEEPRPPDPPVDNQCKMPGSIVGCELQSLGEVLPIAGTPWSLHYDSMRMPGRLTGRTVEIPVTGASPPASLDHVDVRVSVAGRTFGFRHGAGANQRRDFTWDGRDAYGRTLQGRQPAVVSVDYAYRPVFRATPQALQESFALVAGFAVAGAEGRSFVTVGRSFQTEIGGLGVPGPLGGWEIAGHHTYDPVDQVLYHSDGTTEGRAGLSGIETAAAGLSRPEGLALALDGGILVADTGAHVVRRFPPGGGAPTVVAGTSGQRGFAGDGAAATASRLASPTDVAVAPDGAILVADAGNQRIRRVGTDGTISTFAGTGAATSSGDGRSAVDAGLADPVGVAADPSGAVLIVERRGHAVRRVATDGRIATVAGTGIAGGLGDGGPATAARLNEPSDVAFGPDGDFYIADTGSHRVRQVRPDGVIRTVAGTGCPGTRARGARAARCSTAVRAVSPATGAALDSPEGVAVAPDGTLAIADTANSVVRLVDVSGEVVTLAGDGGIGYAGDGGTPLRARLALPRRIAMADGGALLVADTGNDRVRRIAGPLPGLTFSDTVVPSGDGEALYTFTAAGRHERTLDAITGATVQSFVYDGAGLLTGVKDGEERLTTIARDASGRPTAITGPDGQVTELQTGPDGLLTSLEDPEQRRSSFTYTAGGLLATFTDPASAASAYTYDGLGRLTAYTRAGGGTHTLTHTSSGQRTTVTHKSAEGRTVAHITETRDDGAVVRTVEDSGGGTWQSVRTLDGSTRSLTPGGDATDLTLAPDPRFGMAAPLVGSARYQTPAGRSVDMSATRTVDLADPRDPLSVTQLRDVVTIAGRTGSRTLKPPTGEAVTVTAAGRVLTTRFDAQRRIVSSEAPGVLPAQFSYDAAGRPSGSQQGTHKTTLSYGADGYLQHYDDPWGRRASFVRDATGRTTQAQLFGGRTMTIGHDAAGRISSVTPPGAGTHAFGYTARGRVERLDLPAISGSTSPTTLTWSDDDEPEGANLPGGDTLAYAYDAGRRLTGLTDPQATRTIAYEGATGRVASVTRGPESSTVTRDGRLVTGEQVGGTVPASITRTFDSDLRLASTTIGASAPVAVNFDPDGLLTGAGPLTIGRDTASGRARTTSAAAVTTAYEYDEYGTPRAESATGPGGELSRWELTRDDGGRVTAESVRTPAGTHALSYQYDAAGRLRTATDGGDVRTYAYDANGNRLSRSGPGGTAAGTYDARDRIVTWNGRQYSHRATGEVSQVRDPVSGDTTAYGYDGGGRLNSVTLPGGHQVQYVLDPLGRRIAIRRDGATTNRFVYGEALGPSAELDAAGAVSTRYVYGTRINVPDVMLRDGRTFRLLHDARGSVRLVVDAATGTVVQRLDYDEFGRVLTDTNPGFQPFGYAGGIYDHQTGLVLFGARDYDPETGRFMSPDPAGFAGGDGNLYLYAFGDPVNWVDLTGEAPAFALAPIAGAAALGFFTGGAIGGLAYAARTLPGGCFSSDEALYQSLRGGVIGGVGAAVGAFAGAAGLGVVAVAGIGVGVGLLSESLAQAGEAVFGKRTEMDATAIVFGGAGAGVGSAVVGWVMKAGAMAGRGAASAFDAADSVFLEVYGAAYGGALGLGAGGAAGVGLGGASPCPCP